MRSDDGYAGRRKNETHQVCWFVFCWQRNLLILQENGDLKYGDLKIRRWDKSLEKPQLDYSEYFMEDAGQVMCVCVCVCARVRALCPFSAKTKESAYVLKMKVVVFF